MSGDLLEVLAEKLVLSGQLLINMLEELKRNAALSNFAALNSNVAQNETANQAKAAQLHAELTTLQQQLLAQQVCLTGAQQSLPYAWPLLAGFIAWQMVICRLKLNHMTSNLAERYQSLFAFVVAVLAQILACGFKTDGSEQTRQSYEGHCCC